MDAAHKGGVSDWRTFCSVWPSGVGKAVLEPGQLPPIPSLSSSPDYQSALLQTQRKSQAWCQVSGKLEIEHRVSGNSAASSGRTVETGTIIKAKARASVDSASPSLPTSLAQPTPACVPPRTHTHNLLAA